MGDLRRQTRLDRDLDRVVRESGRAPIRGAVIAFTGTLGIVGIDSYYGGSPTVLAYVAVGVILYVVCPSLLVAGIRHRQDVARWAAREQEYRHERESRPGHASASSSRRMRTGRQKALERGDE